MNGKTVVTIVLLAFVAVSVGYLIVGESGSQPSVDANAGSPTSRSDSMEAKGQPADASAEVAPDADAESYPPAADAESAASQHKVIAYYFHSTQRCRTCLKIERLAEEALRELFAEAFDEGALEWRAVNMEQPANEHYVQDYQLVASSLVLVDMHEGKERAWTYMDKVWQYVHGDEATFKQYVAEQAREYLE